MSVILEALKKLDREKSSRRHEPASIAVEILKPELPSPRKRVSLSIFIGIFAIITTAAITYTVTAKFGFLSRSSPPAPVKPSEISQQVLPDSQGAGSLPKSPPPQVSSLPPAGPSPAMPGKPSVPREQAGPAVSARETMPDVTEKRDRAPVEVEDDVDEEGPVIPPVHEKSSRTVMPRRPEGPPSEARKPAEPRPSGSVTTPPSLKLSAIVWYEDPSRRFAVINGVISYEGSVVEGAKVVEIYPDRVRFLQNDRQFEVSMFK